MTKINHILIRNTSLFGCIAFGIIERGTNVIQVRPISECPISCIFCSTDAGSHTKRRISEYMVELQDLSLAFNYAASCKETDEIEAHIDTVGEPLMYPYITELIETLSNSPHVKTVSMQTNGVLLNKELIHKLEKSGLSRINISIEALNPELAKMISGVNSYDIEKLTKNTEYIIKNTNIDVLIAPVWLSGINDEEIPKLIEFALEIGAGKKYPPLGIQKFLPHKYGRKFGEKVMKWEEFYEKLKEFESIYNTKLILKPEDFGSFKCKGLPRMFKKGEKVKLKVIGEGWMKGEKLAEERDRVITIVDAQKIKIGKEVYVRMERVVDGIYIAKPI